MGERRGLAPAVALDRMTYTKRPFGACEGTPPSRWMIRFLAMYGVSGRQDGRVTDYDRSGALFRWRLRSPDLVRPLSPTATRRGPYQLTNTGPCAPALGTASGPRVLGLKLEAFVSTREVG